MRVISMLPAATEMVCALGAGDRLVGVSHECDHPPAVRALPRVTRAAVASDAAAGAIDAEVRRRSEAGESLFAIDRALLTRLAPDVVVTQGLCEVCAVSEEDVRAIAASLHPAPAVVTVGGSTLDGVLEDLARVAAALGLGAAGARLDETLRARVRAVHARLKAASAPRPRVAVIEWTDPVYAAGHWTPELVRRAGGIDVLGTAGAHSRVVGAAEVAAAGPELLVVAPCGFGVDRAGEEAARLLATEAWRWARDLPCWALDGNALLSRPGPRLVESVEVLAAVFNPALFPAPDPRLARALRADAPPVPEGVLP